MNAYELLKPDSKPAGIWACDNCHKVGYTQEYVNQCCRCHYCGKVVKHEKNQAVRTTHEACDTKAQQKRLEDQIAKAEKVENWTGPVYMEDMGHSEGYFESLDELLEELHEVLLDAEDWPKFVFLAKHGSIDVPSIGDILERICDDGFDGLEDMLQGVGELEKALDAFAEANKGIYIYEADCKRAVAVPPYPASQPDVRSTEPVNESKPQEESPDVTEQKPA